NTTPRRTGRLETEETVALTLRKSSSIPPPAAVPKVAGVQSRLAGMLQRSGAAAPMPVRLRKGERRHLTIAGVGIKLVETRPKFSAPGSMLGASGRRSVPSAPNPTDKRASVPDVEHSTLGSEEIEQIAAQVATLLAKPFEAAGARVDKARGESIMAVF